jgi:hypothetical protein
VPADAEVAASHYQRALGYEREAVKIFMPAGADKPVYAPYMEHYPGDVGAQKNWLFNRQRERWKDRQSLDVGGTLDVRIANMTPDERAADAVELVERIRARLERRSTQRLFEELRGRGYDGAHDSVHRFVKGWREERARVPAHGARTTPTTSNKPTRTGPTSRIRPNQ